MSMDFNTDVNVLTGKKLKVESKPVTRNIYLSSSDNTYAKIWTVISSLATSEMATIMFESASMNVFSAGKINAYAFGVIARYSSNRFDLLLWTDGIGATISCKYTSASSSGGTFTMDKFAYQDIEIAASSLTQGSWSSAVAHASDGTATGGTLLNCKKNEIIALYNISGSHACIPQIFSDGGIYLYCVKKDGTAATKYRVTYSLTI